MTDLKALGSTLARIRKIMRLTQRVVAEQIGVTINYISLIENGKREPSIEMVNRLSRVLNTPAGWIYFLAGSPSAETNSKVLQLITTTKKAMLNCIERQR